MPTCKIPAGDIKEIGENDIHVLQFTVLRGRAHRTAEMLAPTENNQDYNYALLDLGALVCRHGLPKCKVCPINSQCDYYLSGKSHALRELASLGDLK